MALDDVLRGEIAVIGNNTAGLRQLKSDIEEGKGGKIGDNEIGLITQYMLPEGENITPDMMEVLKRANKKDPEALKKKLISQLPESYESASNRLISRVAPNYGEIIPEIRGSGLTGMLLQAPAPHSNGEYSEIVESNRNYQEWSKELESGNTNFYLEKAHPLFKEIIEEILEGKEETIKELMGMRVTYEQSNYISNFIKDHEKFNKGQKDKNDKLIEESIDSDKAREYISYALLNSESDGRREVYETMGIAYSNVLIDKQKQKANDADRDALPAAA